MTREQRRDRIRHKRGRCPVGVRAHCFTSWNAEARAAFGDDFVAAFPYLSAILPKARRFAP